MPKRILPKHKAHIVYKLRSGTRVPGVTTITGELGWGKQNLINWANRMGLEGVDTKKYVDDKAKIGTLAHRMVADWLNGIREFDYSHEYPGDQIDEAMKSFEKFFNWATNNKLQPALVEAPLVSELYKYGGTCDIYGKVNMDHFELIDIKTGAGIFDEMIVQVAAYAQLLIEHGYQIDKIRILNIPRSDDETFLDMEITSLCRNAWAIFYRCLLNRRSHNEMNRMRGR